jgi:hypothetical protein
LARCATNIVADETELKALIARLKLGSGRPFSEASPVLECDVQGMEARATVVGRSPAVGRPAALLLLHGNATVTIAHTRTRDLAAVCREAEVLVAAAGVLLMGVSALVLDADAGARLTADIVSRPSPRR